MTARKPKHCALNTKTHVSKVSSTHLFLIKDKLIIYTFTRECMEQSHFKYIEGESFIYVNILDS